MADLDILGYAPNGITGITVEQITAKLTGRNFPVSMLDIDSILDDALGQLNLYAPVTMFAVFETVADQQDYYIFDPDDTVTAGFAERATAIREVYWNPTTDFFDISVFSPGWTEFNQVLLLATSNFHQPSQLMILRAKISKWKDQFGNQGSDILGAIGEASSVLRLYPTPADTGIKVLVEYAAGTTLELVAAAQIDPLMEWVCHYAADALANKYASTAGISLLGFVDSTAAMRYWQNKAEKYKAEALEKQGGLHGEVLRS